jgi:hypothetical protein
LVVLVAFIPIGVTAQTRIEAPGGVAAQTITNSQRNCLDDRLDPPVRRCDWQPLSMPYHAWHCRQPPG